MLSFIYADFFSEKLIFKEVSDMFGNSSKDIYLNSETRPISVSGANDNPYMQELLRSEERRREKHTDDIYNRQNGYIK